MKSTHTVKQLLVVVLVVLVLSVVLSVVSFLPASGKGTQTVTIIDDSFRLTPNETYRQGLGTFHGDENVTLQITQNGTSPANITLLTYKESRYSTTEPTVNYSFSASPDYYEAVFQANAATSAEVHFQVSAQKPITEYPYSWIGTPAKALFVICWLAAIFLILKPIKGNSNPNMQTDTKKPTATTLERNNLKLLKIGILISLAFWFVLLMSNVNPLATFESWYTDAARHPYTSTLFTKVGFSVFDTPLGKLSSLDVSAFKFVSWAEMPHLYPIGSIFLFLPFSALLQSGASQVLSFKLEIAMLLVFAHAGFYLFLKHLWKPELKLTIKEFWGTPFWRQGFMVAFKAFGTYLLYILLVVYAANGQFDAVAFLFSLAAVAMFIQGRHDYFLLLVAVSCTFKYQAGIFLAPLAMVSIMQLFRTEKKAIIIKNNVLWAALGLAVVDVFTALLSAPFLLNVRPELVMNGVNAFSPHAQVTWSLQAFTVLLTLVVTLVFAFYQLKESRLVSLFAIFSLLPIFSMPYFQPWYLPFFFVYPLLPQSKRSLQVTLVWLFFITFVLSFGGLSYNPLAIIDNIRRILRI
jgi:hypothetical protein